MKLTELEISNLGLFQGQHRFHLNTQGAANMVLFSGHNGAGKTTLFSMLGLALHGHLSLGDRVRQETYQRYVLSRLHRFTGSTLLFEDVQKQRQVEEASVRLTLEYVRSGRRSEVVVSRHWERQGTTLVEQLDVTVDGRPADAHREDYQTFVNDLVPPGFGFLCFFDAERLDALSHPDNSAQLSDAIRRLLGLDLVRRLQGDLKRVGEAQQAGKRKNEPLFEALLGHDAEAERAQGTVKDVEQRLADVVQERAEIRGLLAEQQRRLNAEGGEYAARRAGYGEQLQRLNTEIEEEEERLAELATGFLPFMLVPELRASLAERLHREQDAVHQEVAAKARKAQREAVAKALDNDELWSGTSILATPKKTLKKRLLALFEDSEPQMDMEIVHHISEPERERVQDMILQVSSMSGDVPAIADALNSKTALRDKTSVHLSRVPDDTALAEIQEEIVRLTSQDDQLGKEDAELQHKLKMLQEQVETGKKRREQAMADLESSRAAERRLALIHKGQLVLRTYEDALTRQRLESLEQALRTRFNALCRKEQLLSQVEIDPKTYAIRLLAVDGADILLDSFSAGERQLFGLSMLWALRDVTGYDLPLAIDTPLARLDQTHRERLIHDFIPSVSDQVLLFTTDMEFGDASLAQAYGRVAHFYQLRYDAQQGVTVAKNMPADWYMNLPLEPAGEQS